MNCAALSDLRNLRNIKLVQGTRVPPHLACYRRFREVTQQPERRCGRNPAVASSRMAACGANPPLLRPAAKREGLPRLHLFDARYPPDIGAWRGSGRLGQKNRTHRGYDTLLFRILNLKRFSMEKAMRKIAIVLAALGVATMLSAAVLPAQAHDWGYGWRGHERYEHEWRSHRWHPGYYGYRYYAPSTYLAAPGLTFGFAFR